MISSQNWAEKIIWLMQVKKLNTRKIRLVFVIFLLPKVSIRRENAENEIIRELYSRRIAISEFGISELTRPSLAMEYKQSVIEKML